MPQAHHVHQPKSRMAYCTPRFACFLERKQCRYKCKNGLPCSRMVSIGLPHCYHHTIAKYGIVVKDSPNRGKGLFATKTIRANKWICPYEGAYIDPHVMEERYPGNTVGEYAVENVWDAACKRGIGSLANTSSGPHEPNNAVIAYRNVGASQKLWLKSTQDIAIGREILANYGQQYELGVVQSKTYRSRARHSPRKCS